MVFSLIGGAGRMAQAAKPLMNKPAAQPRRRGLIGNVGNMLQQNRQAAPTGDRLMMALSALGGDMTPWMYNQQMQREDRRLAEERQREMQAREGERNTAQKAQMQERERLYQQADALGVPRDQFAFLPDSVREEMLSRQYAPEEPDRPSSYQEYTLTDPTPTPAEYNEFLQRNPRGTQVNVNTNPQGQRVELGNIPQGYQAVFDEQTGSYRMQPVPGSPDAVAAENQGEQRERYGQVVLEDIGRAADLIANGGFATTGRFSGLRAMDPESDAGTLSGIYEGIRANVALDRLQAMREASPTGGAVGQFTDDERRAFETTLGELEQARRPEVQLYILGRLQNMYLDAIYGTPQQLEEAVQAGRLDPATAQQYMQRVPPEEFVQQMLGGGAPDVPEDLPSPENMPDGTRVRDRETGATYILRNGRWGPE